MILRYTKIKSLKIFGAPVYIHWTALLFIALILLSAFKSPIYAVIGIASYLGIIFIHEIGHAIIAKYLNYDVISIKVGLVHGLCEYESPNNEWDEVLVSWGGVLAQFIIGAIVLIIVTISEAHSFGYAGPIVAFLGYINLIIAAINLAPSPGFDGHRALRIFPLYYKKLRAKRIAERAITKAKDVR